MDRSNLTQEEKASLVKLVVLVGFSVAVFYHYVHSAYWGQRYPINTFLFRPSLAFTDFFVLLRINGQFNPYFNPIHPSMHYPFLNFVFGLLDELSYGYALTLYFLLILIPLFIIAWILLPAPNRFEHWAGVLIITFLTYPLLFTLDRGNPEGFVLVLLLLFVYLFQRQHLFLSALLLSMATALKVFPVVFFFLYLEKREFKALAAAVLLTGFLTLGSLAAFEGGFWNNLRFVGTGENFVDEQLSHLLGSTNQVQRGVSLFTAFKMVFIWLGKLPDPEGMATLLRAYFIFAGLLASGLIAYAAFRERIFWKRITMLVCVMLLCPHISAEYKLIHIITPCLLFMAELKRSSFDWLYALFFGALLIPKQYYFFPNIKSDGAAADISVGVPINIALLMIFCTLIAYEHFREVQISQDG